MNIRKSAINYLFQKIIFGLFIAFSLYINGQDGVPDYLNNTEWLEAGDLKKWDKYLGQIEDADKLLITSNDTYLKAALLEADASTDGAKKQKQIAKYEKQAADEYTQALTKYKEIYKGLHDILLKYIRTEEMKHVAYNEMQYNSDQAAQLYSECGKLETDDEREKLSQANELQLSSLEKGISIFTISSQRANIPPQAINTASNNINTTKSSGGSDDIVIDNELYQKYKSYVSDNSIADPIVISQLMLLEGDDAAFAAFEEKWNQYISNEEISIEQKDEIAEHILDSIISEQENSGSELTQTIEQNEVENTKEIVAANQGNVTDPIISSLLGASSPEAVSNLDGEFRVQVAASTNRLSIAQVSAIYQGDLSLIEFKEGSYYKYQIRGFSLFNEAQTICSNSGVDNAYLAAYNKSGSVSLAKAVKENRQLKADVEKYGRQRALRPIEFTVQVAASRERLSPEQLSRIYPGGEELATIFEEGWYKYQILTGKDLQAAFDVLENCGVKKAFIVAYKNGRKLKLYKALNEYKTYR